MVGIEPLSVSLAPELDRFVRDQVSSGRYPSAAEVVNEGLRLLAAQLRDAEEWRTAFRAKIARSTAQADRGELISPDQVLEMIAELKRRRETNAP